MAEKKPKAEPLEHRTGRQQDDNIDDLGRRPDGTKQDMPRTREPKKDGKK